MAGVAHAGGDRRLVDREALHPDVGVAGRQQGQPPQGRDRLAGHGHDEQPAGRADGGQEAAAGSARSPVGSVGSAGPGRRASAALVVVILAPTCTTSAPIVIQAIQ